MDVLEHVEDDAGLLRTYLDKAPPQAQAVITVPAFQFLWSHHDVFLEHHRRYTLKTLSRVVERAGAVPLRMHYYYGTIFPLVAALRVLRHKRRADGSDLRRQPPPVNAARPANCGLERRVMGADLRAGLCVFSVCPKRRDRATRQRP